MSDINKKPVWLYRGEPCEVQPRADNRGRVTEIRVWQGENLYTVYSDDHGVFPGLEYGSVQ